MDAPFRLHTPSSYRHHHHHRLLSMLTVTTPLTFSSSRNTSHRICFANKRPWDSNAESFRNRKFDFRLGDDDDDDIDEAVYQSWIDEGSGFVEKAVDSIFIFKVAKSYGWMLPFIIISLLLVSGPKAFLLTLGLAIGLSLIAYAFQNLLGETQSSPGRKFKRKKRSSTATRSNVYAKPDEGRQPRRKGSTVPWASRNDNSVGKSVQDKPFGGWDELDETVGYTAEPVKMPDRTNVELNEAVDSTAEPVKIPDQTRVRSELNRIDRSRREMSRTPLLLRLLIAAFPFLSSWIKLL
ncbi:unnamed protein product [Rhodiola kirilowii]